MTYDSTTRPASGQQRRDIRSKLLARGWYPIPPGVPRDARLRVPVKNAPTFDDSEYCADTAWTQMWCVCLWERLRSQGKGHTRHYAPELQRYKKSAKLRRAILIAARIATNPSVPEKIAIDAGVELLDPEYREELQLQASPETK